MTTYLVTRKADGAAVYEYNADAPVEWRGFEFATHAHTALPDAPPPDALPTPLIEWPNTMAFLLAFTPAERIAAREARKVDLVLNDFFSLLELAPAVRNDDPSLQAGMGYMVATGLLTAARRTEILGGTV